MPTKCQRARILILSPRAPGFGLGGAERHLHDLAEVLRPISKSVSFRSYSEAVPPRWCERLLISVEPMLASPLALKRLTLPEADVVLSVELMGVGLKHPGHLHLFFGSYAGFRDLALSPVQGWRRIAREMKTRLARLLERRTQHKLGAIANSIGLRNDLLSRNIPVLDAVLLPPTDCSRFCPGDKLVSRKRLALSPDKRILLFAGRWEYAKGADRFARIISSMPKNWHVVIASPSGFTYTPVISPQVTFMIDLDTDQMIDAYRAADVLIQPSRFEGYSLVVSEAQASGCPVFTSPVGQAAHLADAEDVFVRSSVIPQPDDPSSWLTALYKIFADDVTLKRYADAHRAYAICNVSYPVIRDAWREFLSKKFEAFSWQSH
jgi:glycosyltransferase involved in cell wall biosynthesis